jgi:hypothetical protein
MKRRSLLQRLIHGEPDYIVGQPVVVEVVRYNGVFCGPAWEPAKFLGRDDGGHPMVEFKNGQCLKLVDDKQIMG